MPSAEHDCLVELFNQRPALAAELLRDALGFDLPPFDEADGDSADHTRVEVTESRSDRVVVLKRRGRPVLGVVVEVQRDAVKGKLLKWPVYATTLRARLGCETTVLVIATKPSVARWASRPIQLGGGNEFRVAVLALRGGVPAIVEVERARRDPELAVLSAVSHGRDADPSTAARVALAALTAVADLDDDRTALYSDMILAALSATARKAFEMIPEGYQFRSKEGREGQRRGRGDAIFEVLEARGLTMSDAQRERIAACRDLDVLSRWVRRAVTVAHVSELFDEE